MIFHNLFISLKGMQKFKPVSLKKKIYIKISNVKFFPFSPRS
uniref:Uncharacterized protein n=1 Tax=Anguilla anguilla TaxID=7936 RepID=A0A0E9RN68_ANGAN